jgi:hypothetical protein
MLQAIDNTNTDTLADRHAQAVHNYFTGSAKVTVAIREAFQANDWAGINRGLGILPKDDKRSATFRTLVRRVTDSQYTVKWNGEAYAIVAASDDDKRQPSIESKILKMQKALTTLVEGLNELESTQGVDGIADVIREFDEAYLDRRGTATIETVKTTRLSAIRVVHPEMEVD